MDANEKYSLQTKNEVPEALELESIDFFVRLMSLLGLPRSVGEIYGYFILTLHP